MDFNNLMVKITNNKDYQSLRKEKQEEAMALVKGYENYAKELSDSFYRNFESLAKEELSKAEKERKRNIWGAVIAFSPWGIGYRLTKGLLDGLTSNFAGIGEMFVDFANDFIQIFAQDGRFGQDLRGIMTEFVSDFAYAFTSPFLSMAEGMTRGAFSMTNVFGVVDDKDFNRMLEFTGKQFDKMRKDILTMDIGNKPQKLGQVVDGPVENAIEDTRQDILDSHRFGFSEDVARGIGLAGNWVKNKVIPIIVGVSSLGAGFGMESLGGTEASMRFGETLESMGRMVPAIVAAYIPGLSVEAATAISSSYFFASSFGMAFDEALVKGSSIKDAYNYAYGNAIIETMTEQIGGVQLGKILPTKIFMSAFEEGFEEAVSELMSAGLEHIIADGEPVNNEDVWERVMFSAISGAASGAVFGGLGYIAGQQSTLGKTVTLEKQVSQMYIEDGGDYKKTQKKFNENVTKTLDALNKDSIFDINLIESGVKTKEELRQRKNEILKETSFAQDLIVLDTKTDTYVLTDKAKDMMSDLKGYMEAKHKGVAVDKEKQAVSKKTSPGTILYEGFDIAKIENVNKIEDVAKKNFILETLEKSENTVFVEPMEDNAKGVFIDSNGVIYIDYTLPLAQMLAETQLHELTHKIENVNKKGFNKLKKVINDKKLLKLLEENNIEIISEERIDKYYNHYYNENFDIAYKKFFNQFYNDALVKLDNNEQAAKAFAKQKIEKIAHNIAKQMTESEVVSHFIEKMVTTPNVLKKVLNLSPELIESLDLATRNVMTDNKQFAKVEKLFIKYGKQAMQYKYGSLVDAVARNSMQKTYVRFGEKMYSMPKEITGFYNSDVEGNIEASLNETHYVNDVNEDRVPRQYSEISKKALMNFFDLFDSSKNYFETKEQHINSIVDNLLIEYDDQYNYKEIIGTKYAYMWSLIKNNPEIGEAIKQEVNKRIEKIVENGLKNEKLVISEKQMGNIKDLHRVLDASIFRELFALNYITMNPKFAPSVSLYDTNTYLHETKDIFIFNNGLGGFVVSHDAPKNKHPYPAYVANNKKYGFETYLSIAEMASFFNNSDNKELKVNRDMYDFMRDDLHAYNIIAGNEKLESIYIEMGFENIVNADGSINRFAYDSNIMSEWSNSFNNFLLDMARENNVKPIYSELTVKRYNLADNQIKKEKGRISQRAIEIEKFTNAQFEALKEAIDIKSEYALRKAEAIDIIDYETAYRKRDIKYDDAKDIIKQNPHIKPENVLTEEKVANAIRKGEIEVYSGEELKRGVYLSPSYITIAHNIEKGREIFTTTVPLIDVAWLDIENGYYIGEIEESKIWIDLLEEEVRDKFHGIMVANTPLRIGYNMMKWGNTNYATLINQKKPSPDFRQNSEGYGRPNVMTQYERRGYFSRAAQNEYYKNVTIRPVDNQYLVRKGNELKYEKITASLFNKYEFVDGVRQIAEKPKNDFGYWTATKIIEEYEKVIKRNLKPEEKSKIIDLEQRNRNDLRNLLEHVDKHHLGFNSQYMGFYMINPKYISNFIHKNEFFKVDKRGDVQNDFFLVKYTADVVINDNEKNPKGFELEDYAIVHLKKGDKFMFDVSDVKTEVTMYPNFIFRYVMKGGQNEGKLATENYGPIKIKPGVIVDGKRTDTTTNLYDTNNQIVNDVKISNLQFQDMAVNYYDLNVEAEEKVYDIMFNNNYFKKYLNMADDTTTNEVKRGSVNIGIDNLVESHLLSKNIKNEYDYFNKNIYIDIEKIRQEDFRKIDLKEIKKKTNGKKIAEIITKLNEKYEKTISKNYNSKELYNHLFTNVLQEIVLEMTNNFGDTEFISKNSFVEKIETVMARTLTYMDNIYRDNRENITQKNPNGFQYTKLIYWGMRELHGAKTNADIVAVMNKGSLSAFYDLLDSAVKLDIKDNQSILKFMAGIDQFYYATRVEHVNSLALDTKGEAARTIKNVLKQNNHWVDSTLDMYGRQELIKKTEKKSTYKRTGGDLNNKKGKAFVMFDRLSGTRLDVNAFSDIASLYMENAPFNVVKKKIQEAQKMQLKVTNDYDSYYEKNGYLRQNSTKINNLESVNTRVDNLLDVNGNPMLIPNSQILYLRDLLLREIIRNRLIEEGFRGGEQSLHFKDDGIIYINGNTNDNVKNKALRREGRVVNTIELFKELDSKINADDFMKKYNEKNLKYFGMLYEYENIRNKDIVGLELTNDSHLIERLTEQEKAHITRDLGDINIDYIYVPMHTVGSNKGASSGVFNINTVIDLGVDDGMVMGITESKNPPLINSINNVIPRYTKSVANYYGLYRIVRDMNVLFNQQVALQDDSHINFYDKIDLLSPHIIPYYEKLLRDMSGYGLDTDQTGKSFNKAMGWAKRNFFKASLGANLKVIFTQFASAFTLATMYGDYEGSKSKFYANFFKNLFARGSKTKAKFLIENSEIYKDRARNAGYEQREATSSKFLKSKFNRFTEFLMRGMNVTDSLINRTLFITLVEQGISKEQALLLTEQGILEYQSGALPIGKNELLRTSNETIKLFTKFLGEPTKATSNMERAIKRLEVIGKFTQNKNEIFNRLDKQIEIENNKLDDLKAAKDVLDIKIEQEGKKDERAKLEKELKKVIGKIDSQEKNVAFIKESNEALKQEIQKVIDSKQESQKHLAKLTTALVLSLSWQALLAVPVDLIRKKAGDKDEDEEVWKYLSKKFGWQLMAEAVGYIPFARDIYGTILSGYNLNDIADLQAFDGLFKSVYGLFSDIANGGEFNYGKHTRGFVLHLGQILGMPTRQIERFFTTPANYFMEGALYTYKDATGQRNDGSVLTNAIKKGDTKLISTIIDTQIKSKDLSLTKPVISEIKRLTASGAKINPSKVPDKFSIEGIEYKNDKMKFAKVYDNATFVIEKIIRLGAYSRLDDEHKAKLITAIFNYYYNLAKQEVSGVRIYTKERTYNMSQAFAYFKSRIPYYMNMQKKKKQKK